MTDTVVGMNVIWGYIYLFCATKCYASALTGFVRVSLKPRVYKAIKMFWHFSSVTEAS